MKEDRYSAHLFYYSALSHILTEPEVFKASLKVSSLQNLRPIYIIKKGSRIYPIINSVYVGLQTLLEIYLGRRSLLVDIRGLSLCRIAKKVHRISVLF